jgi:hypothetical protein
VDKSKNKTTPNEVDKSKNKTTPNEVDKNKLISRKREEIVQLTSELTCKRAEYNSCCTHISEVNSEYQQLIITVSDKKKDIDSRKQFISDIFTLLHSTSHPTSFNENQLSFLTAFPLDFEERRNVGKYLYLIAQLKDEDVAKQMERRNGMPYYYYFH